MTIDVHLFGQLRLKIGKESVHVELANDCSENCEADTLGYLLTQLAELYPDAQTLLFASNGKIAGGLLVSVGEVATVPTNDLSLKGISTITLLSAISGG